jgi:stage II sporulation protein AB (anti-sigma F factor)
VDDARTFDCSLDTVREVRHWIAEVLTAQRAPENVISDIVLAASEAVTNAIVHGYPETRSGAVDVAIRVTAGSVELTIRDYGDGFGGKPYAPPDTTAAHEGGYGVYLVHSLMDEVTLRPLVKGMELQMKKLFNTSAGS